MKELLDLIDKFLLEIQEDCENVAPGHETTCQCPAHIRVRITALQVKEKVEELRHA